MAFDRMNEDDFSSFISDRINRELIYDRVDRYELYDISLIDRLTRDRENRDQRDVCEWINIIEFIELDRRLENICGKQLFDKKNYINKKKRKNESFETTLKVAMLLIALFASRI